MNRKNMEKILPIQMERNKSKDKKQESNFTLSDMLQVNPIANKTLTSKKRTDKIPPLSNDKIKNLQVTAKNPQKYVNYKQECFHRLNRESKLEDNERFAELLTGKSGDKIKPKSAKNVKETNKGIDTSSKQLAQLNSILDAKKKLSRKNVYTTKNYPILKKTSSVKMKHICSSALYSDDVDSMMKSFDKHMNMDTNEMSLKKPNSSELLKKKTNTRTSVDNSLESFNARLKSKYFNKVYEGNKFDTALKRPNYRSIKELLKINKNDFTTIEASMGKKDNLDLALEDFIHDEESDDCDEKVNNEDNDVLKNHRFYDYLEDLHKEEEVEEEETSKGSITETSKQELYADINKIINKYRPQREKGIKKVETATNSIATGTNDNNISKLRDSIMKSDYLMKEFNMTPVKQINAKNRPATSSKLSEDLEYLLK